MNTIPALSFVPGNIAVSVAFVLLVAGGLVLYALYKKGDVRAVFSHGRTVFKLEAKEPTQSRR